MAGPVVRFQLRRPPAQNGAWTEIRIDPFGKVKALNNSTSLPFLLGDPALLLLMRLSPEGKDAWELRNNRTIKIVKPTDVPGPAAQPDQSPASEQVSYKLGEWSGDTVEITKESRLTSGTLSDGKTAIDMTCTSKMKFDAKQGIPLSMSFEAKMMRNGKQLHAGGQYRYLGSAIKVKGAQAAGNNATGRSRPPAEPRLSLSVEQIDQALTDLKAGSTNKRMAAAELLTKGEPVAASRAKVAAALEGVLGEPNPFVIYAVARALSVWGGEENVSGLVKLVASNDRGRSLRIHARTRSAQGCTRREGRRLALVNRSTIRSQSVR